jgi:protein-S-isoprenylcysteine O-methyltransferase Ste14
MNRFTAKLISVIAFLLGGASLFGFVVFLLFGSVSPIDLDLDETSRLVFDGLLCLGFFIPHSGMIRKSFRRRLGRLVPEYYHGAFYTVVSGITLLLIVAFWQPSGWTLVSLQGGTRVLARVVFILAIVGFWYGIRSLPSLDAFGLRPIRARLRNRPLRAEPLTIRGVYRWVRHPLYFFVLLMIWSFPDLTADRILFNVSWTVWIVVGTVLEERDLVEAFGDAYRSYQQRVPMLVPYRVPMTPSEF